MRPGGYQYPDLDAPGDWDANWLVVRGEVRTAGGESWTFDDPSLTTWEAGELGEWLRAVAAGRVEPAEDPGDEDLPAFTEPNLAFSVAAVAGERTVLRVHLSAEAVARRPGGRGCGVPLSLGWADLLAAAEQWGRDLAPFPAR
nr:hypothetical protein [Kineococcus aurantiacus]